MSSNPTTRPTNNAASSTDGQYRRHASHEDASINWDKPTDLGRIEARYVRRCRDYFVVYLSSQTGCNQGCRMCHLTATKQTQLRNVSAAEFLEQADKVLEFYEENAPPADTVHFNFMARGEPFCNPVLLSDADSLLEQLAARAVKLNVRPRYLISTIFPREMGAKPLEQMFRVYLPEIYYSIYSVNETFRKRWLPKAMPVAEALDRLVSWQRQTYKLFKIHYAFIAGENDSEHDVHAVCDALEERKLLAHVNIVRYNTFDPDRFGKESPDHVLERNAAIFRERLTGARVRIIARVGFDVKASCGMFLPAHCNSTQPLR